MLLGPPAKQCRQSCEVVACQTEVKWGCPRSAHAHCRCSACMRLHNDAAAPTPLHACSAHQSEGSERLLKRGPCPANVPMLAIPVFTALSCCTETAPEAVLLGRAARCSSALKKLGCLGTPGGQCRKRDALTTATRCWLLLPPRLQWALRRRLLRAGVRLGIPRAWRAKCPDAWKAARRSRL